MLCPFNITQFIGTIFSTCVGGVIGYYSARCISDRNSKAIASAKLRAAFAPSISRIELGFEETDTVKVPAQIFFEEVVIAQAAAIEEFGPFVSDDSAAEYEKAWEHYKEIIFSDNEESPADVRWSSELTAGHDESTFIDLMPEIKRSIKAILYFANQ